MKDAACQRKCIRLRIQKGTFGRVEVDSTRAAVITLRVTKAMRDRIKKAAESHGRSVSQELEIRLQNSFLADRSLGGAMQADLLRDIQLVMDGASTALGKPWYCERVSWELVNDAVDFLISAHEPDALPELEKALTAAGKRELERWRRETELTEEQAVDRSRELEQLRLKQRAYYLEPREQMRLELLEALPEKGAAVLPKLHGRDLGLWNAHEEDRIKGHRMWDRIAPILADAAKRAEAKPE